MSGRPLVVRPPAGPADRAALHDVRHEVFVVAQGVPAEIERDALDETADHALALLDGRPVGAGRLVVREDRAVIGRMAVLADVRGTGVGTAVLRHLEDVARQRGCAIVELHAQLTARRFYERAGYTAHGEVYVEAGIDHVDMTKRL